MLSQSLCGVRISGGDAVVAILSEEKPSNTRRSGELRF
jgi:hypothetical protein